ncbi:hypothetical protein BH10ACI2_BH10ACI2_25790 [soil metagenome]
MRILFGMPSPESLGGPIFCEPPFVQAVRDAGIDADEEVYTYGEGLTPTPLWGRVSRVIGAAYRLRRRTRKAKYDIIHLNTSIDEKCVLRDLVTFVFLRSSGVPVYLKMQGSIAPFLKTKSRFWQMLMHLVFSQAAGIGVLSSEERENFLAAGCPPEKLSVAKYVIDSEIYTCEDDFRSRYGVVHDVPVLLFSSRFVPTKGLLDVITACGKLKSDGRKVVLFCLGDGPVRVEAERLVAHLGLEREVLFFGYIPEAETAAFHANSTIFVFPTYHDEGFPLVILKSLAAGLPIITTQIRAAADYLSEPENCLWVSPRSAAELAERIARLLDDNTLRETMSSNNRRLAEQFNADNVVKHYLSVYEEIIGSRKK